MNSVEVRQSFLKFFASNGHKIVKSSSLLPDAPNLLFTNAGMNQFVPIFLGNAVTSFTRAADTQKCIRAGGKHNDLDDVGFDTYHHTFFEMLGNWSFGDYFKEEAIEMAWELLTKVWKFPKERLYATVYSPQPGEPAAFDGESYANWERIFAADGIDPRVHIISGAKRDNFWMMGDCGPCGPCTEIHIDLTPRGDTNGSLVNGGSPWCIELWNLVFIQFNGRGDGTFENLENRHVDTGIGLERIVGIFSKTKNFSDFSRLPSNYDSDLFAEIFVEIEKMCGRRYGGTIPESRASMADGERMDFWFRAIADHVRTLAFAVGDGIFPSNEGRGYVLRRILRRAVMFGKLLKLPGDFFAKLSEVVVEKMGSIFHELAEQRSIIGQVLQNEEAAFSTTIDRGVTIFNEICAKSPGRIAGTDAFLLYDTYGFPIDLTQLMAAERGIAVDTDGFEVSMERQRSLARSSQKKTAIGLADPSVRKTEFVGYDIERIENVPACAVDMLSDGKKTFLIFDKTPFYAESGGQVGDRGTVRIGGDVFRVTDVQKDKNGRFLHEVDCEFAPDVVGKDAILSVDRVARHNSARNHSATHLLHFALQRVLGNHVKQAGSYLDDRRLRFDFNAFSAPTERELEAMERIVMEKILDCVPSNIFESDMDKIPEGCIANFGEKYGAVVRVVEFGEFSKVLCGGCHVGNTSEIACFKIVSSSSVAAGVRRIEAVTGGVAFDLFMENCSIIEKQCGNLSCQPSEICEKIDALVARCKELEKSAKAARHATLRSMAAEIASSAAAPDGGIVRVEKTVEGLQPEELRTLAVDVLSAVGEGVVTLTASNGKKYSTVACCSKAAVAAGYHAGNIVREIASSHGGSGGGRPELAMGGYMLQS
jgi:alanyl-tRNA synthetase